MLILNRFIENNNIVWIIYYRERFIVLTLFLIYNLFSRIKIHFDKYICIYFSTLSF